MAPLQIAVTDARIGDVLQRRFELLASRPRVLLQPAEWDHCELPGRFVIVIAPTCELADLKDQFSRHLLWPISLCHSALSSRSPPDRLELIVWESSVDTTDAQRSVSAAVTGAVRGLVRNLRCEMRGRPAITFRHLPSATLDAVVTICEQAT